MSNPGSADEWDVVVPADGEELLAEFRRHGVQPGESVRVRSTGRSHLAAVPDSGDSGRSEEPPEFFGSVRSGRRDLAQRSQEILRAEFPGE